jgi:hypothetical protein
VGAFLADRSASAARSAGDGPSGVWPEVLSGREFTYEVTELILNADDEITAAQALAIRRALDGFARSQGWVV